MASFELKNPTHVSFIFWILDPGVNYDQHF